MKKLLYVTLSLIGFAILSFQSQEPTKFYYAFKEKVYLTEIENKISVRFIKQREKETINSSLRRIDTNAKVEWPDGRTVIVTTSSKSSRDRIMDDLKENEDIVSYTPIYKINSGLEMALTDEIPIAS